MMFLIFFARISLAGRCPHDGRAARPALGVVQDPELAMAAARLPPQAHRPQAGPQRLPALLLSSHDRRRWSLSGSVFPFWVSQVQEFTRRGVEEHKGNYNVWYGKYESTEGKYTHDRGKDGVNPETRCVVAKDTGKTKGDTQPSALLCYLFAQGRCHNGPECNFLHRIPDKNFEGEHLAHLEHSSSPLSAPAWPPAALGVCSGSHA